jgi:hypothetical protein
MMVSVGCPRVWCLKNTRFWFPLPTSRISGLAVDLSFSCHPRHRSWGRPVVSHIPKDDQNVSRRLPLSRHGFVVIIPMQNIRSSIPYSKRQAQSKQKWYLVTWSSIPWKKVIRSNWIHAGMVANHSLLSGFLLWSTIWMMWGLPIPYL